MGKYVSSLAKAIVVKNLKKIYSNGNLALDDIDFSIEQGDFFALLGPNGAGKSSLIGILTSLITKDKGRVYIHGHDLDKDLSIVKKHIGVVPQEFNFNIFPGHFVEASIFYGVNL